MDDEQKELMKDMAINLPTAAEVAAVAERLTAKPYSPKLSEEDAADLRAPFPTEAVGLLPKPYRKDSPRSWCDVCHSTHGEGVHLDYVGHAAVTDRLLSVDPRWHWEPMALDPDGLPQFDHTGGLWIKLTVKGVTRLGYGDGATIKERIGDAIRNAAMRFGVALDLWTKDELESQIGNEVTTARKRKAPKGSTSTKSAGNAPRGRRDPESEGTVGMTLTDRNKIVRHMAHMEPPVSGGDAQCAVVSTALGLSEPVAGLVKLTEAQGKELFRLWEIT